jgi:hypothetical protein
MYPIDIIGVVVTLAKKVVSQYSFHIKYGNKKDDKEIVYFSIVDGLSFI